MLSLLKKLSARIAAVVTSVFCTGVAMAGTGGTEFEGLYNLVRGWSDGFLGKALAIAAFLVGAIIGFAKSTAMPALVGIVFAVLFAIGPGIIDGIATAVF